MRLSIVRHATVGLLSVGMLLSSTVASAANAPSAAQISPWVALSAFGTQSTSNALCASSAAAAAASTSAQAAPAKPGCVLPVVDAVPPAVEPVAPYMPAIDQGGFAISPLMLGLGALALAGLIYLISSEADQDDDSPPISPD